MLFPIAFTFISIVLFFISFIIGRWEGMGMGAVSISLFVASIIALIAIVLLYKIGPNSSKNHHQY
ncbi:YesK family protein [Virgibacillus necropolis]|uniref:YesK family protein n=1 Tax=Virgibacillus necropolis TaxID=163877 RepID=UPI00222089F5|nr:YesK family protein [Virgibacillus necropolis]